MEQEKIEPPVIEHGFVQEVEAVEKKPDTPEKIDFVAKLVKPHNKVSRDVTQDDVARLSEDGKILFNLCYTQVGLYPGAYAMHHSQIDDQDPLNYFVTANREIIINPKIIRHTKTPVDSKEGCMTFGDKEMITVPRYHKIEVEYRTITDDGKLTEIDTLKLSGRDAFVFQHEIEHGLGKYIYQI